jgi:hypothetical protein
MEQGYRWSETREEDTYRLPGSEHLGRWATAAMVVSILLHALVFFALDQVKFALGIQQPEEISTGQINIRQVEVKPYEPDRALPPEEIITPPNETAALLEQVDLLDLLPEDPEIDIAPNVVDPAYALKISSPLAEGELDAEAAYDIAHVDALWQEQQWGRDPLAEKAEAERRADLDAAIRCLRLLGG